jgi:hypothetical protein
LNNASTLSQLDNASHILETHCLQPTLSDTKLPKRREKYLELSRKIEEDIERRIEDEYQLIKMILKKAGKRLESIKLMKECK